MNGANTKTVDELFALEEMEAFLQKAQQKCRAKVANRTFAGMEVDDVIQEVLLKVYRSMQSYDGTLSKVSTYLDHVMDNMIRDCLRKAGSKTNLAVVNAMELVTTAAPGDSTKCGELACAVELTTRDPGFERVELWLDVMENLQLSEREREVFRLRLSGYEFVEIAQMLGISKARVSQIWKRLKEKYMSL